MIVYHGTTLKRAHAICVSGFQPRKPSRRVWFAESRRYAQGRAKTQARRARDHPVVLSCDLDLKRLRAVIGTKRVRHVNGIIAIDGPVGATVVRQSPGVIVPRGERDLARFFNRILGLKPWKGISSKHGGIQRMVRWVEGRMSIKNADPVKPQELLELAHQWLPEYFNNVEVDPKTLEVHRSFPVIHVVAQTSRPWVKAREDEAIDLLDNSHARQRIAGLKKLAELGDPDMADWCAMFLDDPSLEVKLAAMKLMRDCRDVDPRPLRPLVRSENLRIRGAALALLVQFDANHRERWLERALKDPAAHVRVMGSKQLKAFDAKQHRRLYEFALTDPNPQVAKTARKLTAHKGYARMRW